MTEEVKRKGKKKKEMLEGMGKLSRDEGLLYQTVERLSWHAFPQ